MPPLFMLKTLKRRGKDMAFESDPHNPIIIGKHAHMDMFSTDRVGLYLPVVSKGDVVTLAKCLYVECWEINLNNPRQQPADIFDPVTGKLAAIVKHALVRSLDQMVYTPLHLHLKGVDAEMFRHWAKFLHREGGRDINNHILSTAYAGYQGAKFRV